MKRNVQNTGCEPFRVSCDAGRAGRLDVGTAALSVAVGLRTSRSGREEVCDAVLLNCEEHSDGSRSISVLFFHPDWPEGREVARIDSQATKQGSEVSFVASVPDWK
jgi:hypothetical protein